MLINVKRTYINTSSGRKYLSSLDDKARREILKNIQKDWKQLIKLHFQAEGGITSSNGIRNWRPLSDNYVIFKRESGLSTGILEASTPSLSSRYQMLLFIIVSGLAFI